MILSLLLLCAAASAIVSFGASLLIGVALLASRRWLASLAAPAQARVWLGAALFPALVCAAVMTAALAPSFGWIIDHCAESPALHLHPHLCAAHHVGALPASTLIALGAVLALRLGHELVAVGRAVIRASSLARALSAIASRGERGLRVLPFDAPQAFVLGTLRPSLFVTRGLLAAPHRRHLHAVLAHERAHLRRRDPLRRIAGTLALAFHLPGIARFIDRHLAEAHEMAADADAARAIQSPARVADALVKLSRARLAPLPAALGFGGSGVENRVAMLMDSRPRLDRPQSGGLWLVAAAIYALIAASADTVHHGVDLALGLFGG